MTETVPSRYPDGFYPNRVGRPHIIALIADVKTAGLWPISQAFFQRFGLAFDISFYEAEKSEYPELIAPFVYDCLPLSAHYPKHNAFRV